MRHRIALALLIVLDTAALVVVWTRVPVPAPVDWAHPAAWLARTDPETATLVVGRLLVIALAAWLLLSTVAALAVEVVLATVRLPRRVRRLLGAVRHLAPGTVRHLVQAAVAVSLVTGATGRPAFAVSGAAPDRVRPVVGIRAPIVPLAPVRDGRAVVAALPGLPALPAPVAPPPVVVPAPAPAADTHHVVQVGESLWTIAEDTVRTGGSVDDPDAVHRYWRALCDANRDRVASGDLNAILPGEDLDLPPVA